VEVVVPEDHMGPVTGDLKSAGGQIEEMERRGSTQIIRAIVPLSEMFGYPPILPLAYARTGVV